MDPFDKKREMVSQLLDMLRKHASDEVDSGLKKPEGEGDMHGLQVEKVEILPDHEMDKATPEHEVDTKLVDEGKHTSSAGYSKGGVVEQPHENGYKDAPNRPTPYESADGQPDKEGSAHEEATESDEEREAEGDIEPMFTSLFGRKKKK